MQADVPFGPDPVMLEVVVADQVSVWNPLQGPEMNKSIDPQDFGTMPYYSWG